MDDQVKNIQQDLIDRCRNGEQGAFRRLYQLYAKAMYNVAYRITGNSDDAADALQEAFISVYHHLDSYRGDATFGSWLKRIVINKGINLIKKRRVEMLPEDEGWDVPEEAPLEIEDDEMAVERIRRAIHLLPEGYRAVISLYLVEGYDHQEIAEILGVTESTSKSQLNRAKQKLRELLSPAKGL